MIERLVLSLVLAGCAGPTSTECGDGFCPAGTACGGAGVCLVVPGTCASFPARTPCMVDDRARGTCEAGSCVRGVAIGGGAVGIGDVALPGVTARVRGHPAVRPVTTNINGFFDLVDVPRDSTVLVELALEDSVTAVTRPLRVADRNVVVDVLYGGIPMLTDAFVDVLAQQLGITRLPGTSIISGTTFDPATDMPLGGVSFAVEGTSCDGPFYFDRNGIPQAGGVTDDDGGVFGFANCTGSTAAVVGSRAGAPCRTLDASSGPIALELIPDQLSFTGRVVCD